MVRSLPAAPDADAPFDGVIAFNVVMLLAFGSPADWSRCHLLSHTIRWQLLMHAGNAHPKVPPLVKHSWRLISIVSLGGPRAGTEFSATCRTHFWNVLAATSYAKWSFHYYKLRVDWLRAYPLLPHLLELQRPELAGPYRLATLNPLFMTEELLATVEEACVISGLGFPIAPRQTWPGPYIPHFMLY